MRRHPLLPATLAFSSLFAPALDAQLRPGERIVSVMNQGVGELHIVDGRGGRSTKLQLGMPVEANCVTMLDESVGWVGGSSAPALIHLFAISRTGVLVKPFFPLRSSLRGQEHVAGITRVGDRIYFVTRDAATASGGTIWTSTLYGGVHPTRMADLSLVRGFPVNSRANAIASNGTDTCYVAVWPGGEILSCDVPTRRAQYRTRLPASRTGGKREFRPVGLELTEAGLTAVGAFGDVVVLDVQTMQPLAHHQAGPKATSPAPFVESASFDAAQGHFVVGTAEGSLDVVVPIGTGQLARRALGTVGDSKPGLLVTGLAHLPTNGRSSYRAFAPGCAGSGGLVPTSHGQGTPSLPNPQWGLGLAGVLPGSHVAIVALGAQRTSVDLAGLALPGCSLWTLPLIVLPVPTMSASPSTGGSAMLPLPLSSPVTLQTQWWVWDTGRARFDAVSDGRTLLLRR